MKKFNVFILITISFIWGCEQNNSTSNSTTESNSTTIFENHPDWNYLYCKSFPSKNDAFIKTGSFLVIEPKKNNPIIYAWKYRYELDLTWGGKSDIESKMIKGDWDLLSIEDLKKFEPNFKYSSFFKNTSMYCGNKPSAGEHCNFYVIDVPEDIMRLTDYSERWYLNRTNLLFDRTQKDIASNDSVYADQSCKVVDINSTEFVEIKKGLYKNYDKALIYLQSLIDRHNEYKNVQKEAFKT